MGPRAVENPQGSVTRRNQSCRHLHGLLENILERGLRAHRDVRFNEAAKALLSVSDPRHRPINR
jgi:hypothetical protein